MTTALISADARLEDLDVLVSDYLAVLNDKEVTRRAEVNSHHFGQYGRLLYPEGGQYATFAADAPGRKFQRITMNTGGEYGGSVHAFIDLATGDVLKPASFKTPAKGARYNLLDAQSRAELFERCDFAGSYLYRKAAR